MHSPTPAQRIRRWHTYLIVWTVHRVLALGLGALILLASLSGGALVLHHELERIVERDRHVIIVGGALRPDSSNIETAGSRGIKPLPQLPITTLVRAAARFAPEGYRPFRLTPADSPDASDKIMFVSPNGRTRWSTFVNPFTAEVLWHGADQSLFTPWLLGLHMHLHLGGWGYLATGLSAIALALLGATGLYIYRDRRRGLWRRPMRLNHGWRVAWSDLHKWIGMLSIYFSLMLGVTGAIYSFTIAPGQIAVPKPLAAPFDFARLAPIEPMLAQVRTRFPAATIQRVAFPTNAKAALTILLLERDAPVWRKFSRMEFDPATGVIRAVRDSRDATPREKFSAMLAPLHMGFYGSPLVKWLYAIGGFAPALLSLSGAAIWLLRTRKARAAPAPHGASEGAPVISPCPIMTPASSPTTASHRWRRFFGKESATTSSGMLK